MLGLEVTAAVCGTATLLWEVVEQGLGGSGSADRTVAFTFMRVLDVTAQRIRRCLRDGDFVARYAGDEFVAIAADIDHPAAHALAQRISDALSAPTSVPGATVTIGASVGTVMIDHSRPVESCLAEADRSMYERKRLRAT